MSLRSSSSASLVLMWASVALWVAACNDDLTVVPPTADLQTSLVLSRSEVTYAETLTVTVTVTNKGTAENEAIVFSCIPVIGIRVVTSNGDDVPLAGPCYEIVRSLVLDPGESEVEWYRLSGLPPGEYTVEAGLKRLQEDHPWATAPFRVVAP